MTTDEAVALLAKTGHATVIEYGTIGFYVSAYPMSADGTVPTDDNPLEMGEGYETVEEALDDFTAKFSRG